MEVFSREELEKRLLAKREIDEFTDCWVWTGCWHKQGYGLVGVSRNPRKELFVHIVAAHLWINLPLFGKHVVVRNCKCRACFNPAHLKVYESRKKSLGWYRKKKLHFSGENVTRATMTLEKALDVRDALKIGEKPKEIAERLGITRQQVYKIKHRRCWAYVWKINFDKKLYDGKFGDKYGII